GTQILPSDFVTNATTPIEIPNSYGPGLDYGWHWWMRADLGIYFAWGRHGQKIMVAPEHDLVVVFTAGVPDDGYDPEFELFRDYILPAIAGYSNDLTLLTIGIIAISGVGVAALTIVYRHRRARVS
ncbi:MAG: hypothetical protein ACFFEV_03200, partial [Candidatus Thorarchaeota archaeon]